MYKRYHSIENSYRQKFIDCILINEWDKGIWYVTEKVHGANFSFLINTEGNIKCAKRSGPLSLGENFFNYQLILEKLTPNLTKLHDDNFKGKSIIIFGEIYGGWYGGKQAKDSTRVQEGVDYSLSNDFVMFDIYCQDNYIPFNHVISYGLEYDIPIVPVLKSGTFRDCVEYPNMFPTHIPSMYHKLHPLPDNFCEGTVIRPNDNIWFQSKSSGEGSSRIILKNKNENFTEKDNTKVSVVKEIPEEVKGVLTDLTRLITPSRVLSVVSKIGEVTYKDFPTIMGDTVGDVIEEYNKDSSLLSDMEKLNKKIITKELQRVIAPLVKDYLNKNV